MCGDWRIRLDYIRDICITSSLDGKIEIVATSRCFMISMQGLTTERRVRGIFSFFFLLEKLVAWRSWPYCYKWTVFRFVQTRNIMVMCM